MTLDCSMPEHATQILPREAYTSQEWFDREMKELFAKTWGFAGLAKDVANPGDYMTAQVGTFTLFVIRGSDGELRAFHNICRHRGTELVDRGCGNKGKTIVCPYHRWTFGLDGALRGVPDQKALFPDFDKKENGLHPASVGEFKGLVFVSPEPDLSFDAYLSTIPEVVWPHDLNNPELVQAQEKIVYEMECNWKVFFENAIDGYHLLYLHEHTLGGPHPEKNVWEPHGDHQVWYSTEQENIKSRIPQYVAQQLQKMRLKPLVHAGEHGYGGVYAMFPTTLVVTSPYSFSLSIMHPTGPNTTRLEVLSWMPKARLKAMGGLKHVPGYDKTTGTIKSSHWKVHPLETGDFQTEDVYVAEKMQRSLQSPKYSVGQLASGPGAESPLTYFQQCVRNYVPEE
ncbi:Anthranilate 1,2-dioxygenase large subunit [Falsiruegeria litorea R37]|uniref:Anthranilate 1,2-dioxygenase large subunit n=1 Tax=Falsiruegeria litorea R37 TaxID=1200284 RepID=A0A1Y5RWA8_9RHOB|nr:SRPBCC family protein [Falsiruegeria litorea]SLN25954.1 Anthranilate 1,2-dioxygenase large subunit [Falsiruegeria litorea R37]